MSSTNIKNRSISRGKFGQNQTMSWNMNSRKFQNYCKNATKNPMDMTIKWVFVDAVFQQVKCKCGSFRLIRSILCKLGIQVEFFIKKAFNLAFGTSCAVYTVQVLVIHYSLYCLIYVVCTFMYVNTCAIHLCTQKTASRKKEFNRKKKWWTQKNKHFFIVFSIFFNVF